MIRGGDIGKMDMLFTIQMPVLTYDSVTNEQLKSWTDVGTLWGEDLKYTASKESFEADQQVSILKYYIKVRYQSLITTTMRLVRNGEYNYIMAIEFVDRDKFMILTTEKRDNV